MRKFFSYGPIDRDMHFYAPREELITEAWNHVVGENPDKGGHYITVWAPCQAGKSWIMQQILWKLQKDERFDVLKLNLENLKRVEDTDEVIKHIAGKIISDLELQNISADSKNFEELFQNDVLQKPLILIMDEFDALSEDAISAVAEIFRNIHNFRRDDTAPSAEKKYLLHGVALIGVRSVLGIENVKGSPFNVQRSLHIPNLTFEEVEEMFRWYERESGQKVEQEVIER
ncbi:MAG: AAA-like domain-containing protein, partial [Desulfococcaceae bacterium]|nr:AAA-like domain-containing protein [Desulfococcaceae bacterium]